jgi:hypothetical protein
VSSPVTGLSPEQYLALTAIGKVSDEVTAILREKVAAAMRASGEDPDNPQLFALRCTQAAYSVDADARQAWIREASR